MTTTSLLSELEAVNIMLTAADEDPVQTLEQPGHLPLSIARSILDDVSRVVQSMGWAFNTERDFTFPPGTNGGITLSPNTLSVDIDDLYSDCDPVQRGLKLYDRKGHTYVFTRPLKGTIIFLLPWDELPHAARYYIAVRAARACQVRLQAGELVFKYSEQDEQMALLALQSFEADTADANFLTDSHSVSSVLAGRY
jgi:hypothetical protein